MNGDLWVVVGCLGRRPELEQTMGEWLKQPQCRYVLVDDGKCADWAEKFPPRLSHFPAEDGSGWIEMELPGPVVVHGKDGRRSAARNEGAEMVPDEAWICFVDADLLPKPFFCKVLASWLNDRMEFWAHPLGNLTIVHKSMWKAVGGFGGKDFHEMLIGAGVRMRRLDDSFVCLVS